MSKDIDFSSETLSAIRTNSAPRAIRIEHLWLVMPVLVLLYEMFSFPLPVLDFWWHLKMGEVIARTHTIPNVDTFSFTAAGKHFVLQNWLGELVYYWVYQLGSLPLLLFFGAMITLAGFLLVYHLCLQAGGRVRIVSVLGLMAAVGNYGFLRPQTYSFLLFAAFYWVLVQYREGRRDVLWLLPLLTALWVNLHGAFVLGIGLIGLFVGCEGARRFIDPEGYGVLSRDEIRKLFIIFLLCGAATLVNPEGFGIFDYVRTVVLDPGSQKLVSEWRPPQINTLIGAVVFYLPLFAGVLIFIHSRRKPDLLESTLFFGFAAFGLTAIRNAAWFATVAYPIMARYLPHVDFDSLRPLHRHRAIRRIVEDAAADRAETRVHARLNAAILGIAIVILAIHSPWLQPKLIGRPLWSEQTPVGAANFIEQRKLTGRIFHPQVFGDYLMWRLWPQQKTFVDGRVHLFTLDFLEKYNLALEDPLGGGFLDQWKIDYILLSKSEIEASSRGIKKVEVSPAWTKIYEDEVSAMFERK